MIKVNLVAIAKNEADYIVEWLAHHLALGFDNIHVFDNESDDQTGEILRKVGSVFPVSIQSWATPADRSPQFTAYAEYLKHNQDSETMTGFIDIDEFIIPRNGSSPVEHLRRLGADPTISAVCINQRIFGDAGKPDYSPDPVLKRLPRCAVPSDPAHRWVKSFYRLSAVERVSVHSSPLLHGRYVHPNGRNVTFVTDRPHSVAEEIDYSLIQLNHYTWKTLGEFRQKALRGGVSGATRDVRLTRYRLEDFAAAQPRRNATECADTAQAAARIDALIAEVRRRAGLG